MLTYSTLPGMPPPQKHVAESNQTYIPSFELQICTLIFSPAFIAAGIYVTLRRLYAPRSNLSQPLLTPTQSYHLRRRLLPPKTQLLHLRFHILRLPRPRLPR